MTTRRQLLWMGDAPPDRLVHASRAEGLELVPLVANQLRERAPSACGLAFPLDRYDEDWVQALQSAAALALDHGLRVGVVCDRRDPQDLWTPSEYPRFRQALQTVTFDDRIKFVHDAYDLLARFVREAGSERSANIRLRIGGVSDLEPAEDVLLRRAFSDEIAIELRGIEGAPGHSGARIRIVEPREGRLRYTVVSKIQPLEKSRLERSNYSLIQDVVGHRYRANLFHERCSEGARSGMIVYSLVHRAEPLIRKLPAHPREYIRSLVEVALEHFVDAPTRRDKLGARLVGPELKIVRQSAALAAAADGAPHAVDDLLQRVSSLPDIEYAVSTIHGDLHVGNLFALNNSYEVMMIDFGSVKGEAPAALDLAMFEVSLTFPSEEHVDRTLPLDIRRQIYGSTEVGSVPRSTHSYAWILDSVSAVREHLPRIERRTRVYAQALIAALLRSASFEDHGTETTRRVAYLCACDLLDWLEGAGA